MRWSRLKSIIESLFAPTVARRLAIHITGYGNSRWGRSWLTWDGQEIVNFSDDEAYQRRGRQMHFEAATILPSERTPGLLVEAGEFSSIEFKNACYRFKDMEVGAAYNSQETLLVALSTTHRKLGRHRLSTLATEGDHPLIRYMAHLRLEAEWQYSQNTQLDLS